MPSYEPRYIQVDDVPVQVPDDYNEEEKISAIEKAEATFELDVNNGLEIEQETVDEYRSQIQAAVKQKATATLIRGAAHPNAVKLGDLQEPSGKEDLAETFDSRYQDIVARINEIGIFEDSSTNLSPYTYTTK